MRRVENMLGVFALSGNGNTDGRVVEICWVNGWEHEQQNKSGLFEGLVCILTQSCGWFRVWFRKTDWLDRGENATPGWWRCGRCFAVFR